MSQQVRARTFTGRPPSKDARQRHMVTHIPYQPWCSICVAARGVANRHRQVFDDERLVPTVAFDYCFIRPRQGAQSVTVLVARIRDSRYTFAHALPHKGVYVDDLATRLADELEKVGLRGKPF